MKYDVVIAHDAQVVFNKLDARWRSRLKEAMQTHLLHNPTHESRSRIKRLRGLQRPQFRMRVDEMRVFYDVNKNPHRVEVLGFVRKSDAAAWLAKYGVPK
jgi:mRNA-degrading endonuclease RelE of RelBE toxin-antitoxin system